MDLSGFKAQFPALCDEARMRTLGAHEPAPGARELDLSAEAAEKFSIATPKDPGTLPAMLKQGPEAVAYYVSFRTDPERFGIYVRAGGTKTLKEEYHRIIWRDLGKYADQNVDDIAEKVEMTLVLDYLLAHNRVHFLVDRAAADSEIRGGAAKYAPYQAKWYNPPPKPVLNPEDVGNLEEALANLEAFRQYINPTYADGVAKLVEGRLDERNVNEWKAFFIGGRFAVEMANVLSRQPPGWKDFGKFLNRKTSVGATNYVRIQYSYNPETLERGQIELSRRLLGGPSDTPNLFKAEAADFPNVYLL